MLTHLHYVVDLFNVSALQPERSQPEHPGVMLLTLLQTLDVVLHRLAQESLSVRPQIGQRRFIQLHLSLHLYRVPETSFHLLKDDSDLPLWGFPLHT